MMKAVYLVPFALFCLAGDSAADCASIIGGGLCGFGFLACVERCEKGCEEAKGREKRGDTVVCPPGSCVNACSPVVEAGACGRHLWKKSGCGSQTDGYQPIPDVVMD